MRVAIGGFRHQTNTFALQRADLDAFVRQDSRPGLQHAETLLASFARPASGTIPINVPIAGFIREAAACGLDLVPLAWAAAMPSAHVTTDAYAQIAGIIVEELERAQRREHLDAIYLDLHGAMVTEEMEDGEGELLEWVRDVTGPRAIIVASLDLHANMTAKMARCADLLVTNRAHPQADFAATGARAARLVAGIGAAKARPARAFRKIDYLIPLTAQSTLADPAALVCADAAALDGTELAQGRVMSASVALGFAPADIAECGPAVVAYADTQAAADEAADQLAGTLRQFERGFRQRLWEPEEAVAYGEAADAEDRRAGPLVLADTQDDPAAGANGDTVGLLRALISGADTALCGVLHDPATATAAWTAGEGAAIRVSVGAWTGGSREEPIHTMATVLRLHDGDIEATGPLGHGERLVLGPSAMLAVGGVRVIVATFKVETAHRAIFSAFGADPRHENIVAVKSSVHFRADLEPIARDILVVASPGANPADHAGLAYRRLRDGVRLMPMGPAFQRSHKPLK